jgi:hypothetical protein
MVPADLHVFAARFNPLRYETPDRIYRQWVDHMRQSGVTLTVIECQYGERPFTCDLPGVNHIGVRAQSAAWSKENLINIGLQRTPQADYVCWCDTDVFFENPKWATECLEALQLYRWIQPWSQAIDRGPHGEVLTVFRPFCYQYEQGAPLVPDRHGWKNYAGQYPHPGYCHASTRRVLEYAGGLFELGGMGASDHAMMLALVGKAENSAPKSMNVRYVEHLMRWQERIQHSVHGRIGYANGVINHSFHGAKAGRQYLSRWEMFLRHGFDPDVDLMKNTYGVIEWAGNKPELIREWLLYLKARNEDANTP